MKNLTRISLQAQKEHYSRIAFKLTAIMILFILFLACSMGQAQTVNISSQAVWGPTGYDYVEYYYMPQMGVYYYVPTSQFIYPNGSSWTSVSHLPSKYQGANLYTTYKVVVNEPKPYLQHNVYKVKYANYNNGGPTQIIIRDSQEAKYFVVKGHPKHGAVKSNINNGNTKPVGNSKPAVKPQQKSQNNPQPKSSNGGGGNGGGAGNGGGGKPGKSGGGKK